MASPSFAAAATSPASSPLTLDAIPLASRPAPGAAAAQRKRSVFLLNHRPHPVSPTPPLQPTAAASAQHARRKKTSHPPRPRWQTVLSIAAKNAALLAALLYLGDLAWRWSHPPPPSPPPDRAALEGYAARVDEVEASLTRTFRMIQVQLEAVDRKIDGEVGAARGDLLALLEDKRLALERQLTRLDARAGELGDALAGLKRMEFLRKDEFEKFWDEVKGSLGSSSESEVDLDQVRALAREIVMREIEKHAADGIGRVDYAVASGGGRVVRHSEAYVPKRGFMVWMSGVDVGPKPEKMLQPSFGEPGQCFALQGSNGFVEVKLKSGIIPEAVTLEHVSKDVAYDRSTAPKGCRVYGWYEETPGETQSGHAAKMALAEFAYDLEKNNVQTFDVTAPDVGVINMVRLDFTSNHGSSQLTCIYRLRVHGHEPVSPGSSAGSQA
ncbi:SUN domain-containing protein 1-like [Zea mays]|uniref:SUN domain protein2 n=1 Tax=Zea mays TaxID=4577 RepID=B6TY16_MAIZE|nr:SUN domain-containing protein 1-like [Zea mays]ACG41999.1 sad1/unc-84-like protein 2 [Zea mays]ACL54329.1 unknown [Zea mays]ONM31176.1 SUN domain protein2 [Zea mays]|eukprot:NP_001146585.1 uncharacterized protein LOC100280181 [Zea mays]